MEEVKGTGSATVLGVTDIAAAEDFYINTLGFEKVFEYGDPCFYMGLRFGVAQFHLNANPETAQTSAAYIFLKGVRPYYERLLDLGVEPVDELKEYPYGMTDFDIVDPFGNVLTFGEGK